MNRSTNNTDFRNKQIPDKTKKYPQPAGGQGPVYHEFELLTLNKMQDFFENLLVTGKKGDIFNEIMNSVYMKYGDKSLLTDRIQGIKTYYMKAGIDEKYTYMAAFEALLTSMRETYDYATIGRYLPIGENYIFNQNNYKIMYQKLKSDIDREYEGVYKDSEGILTLTYSSPEGCFQIRQQKICNTIYELWISEDMSEELKKLFVTAYAKTLKFSVSELKKRLLNNSQERIS